MPYHVVDAVACALNERQKSLKGSKILLLGVAYKKDVDDLRESPSLKLLELLTSTGAVDGLQRSLFRRFAQNAPLRLLQHALGRPDPRKAGRYDCVLIATDHSSYDYDSIVRNPKLVVDTRNATRRVQKDRGKIVNC